MFFSWVRHLSLFSLYYYVGNASLLLCVPVPFLLLDVFLFLLHALVDVFALQNFLAVFHFFFLLPNVCVSFLRQIFLGTFLQAFFSFPNHCFFVAEILNLLSNNNRDFQ